MNHRKKNHMELVLPRNDTYAPRDGQRLGRTDDWIFALLLCRNVAANRHQYRIVRECGDLNFMSRDKYVYLLEHYTGELRHPMTLERVTPREVQLMNEIRPDTLLKTHCRPLIGYQLRAGVYEHFFVPAEQADFSDDPLFSFYKDPARLRIGRLTIWPCEATKQSILEKLNARLTWPLQPEDRILEDWQRRLEPATRLKSDCSAITGVMPILSQFFLFDQQAPDKFDALCPLDGYVKTISAKYRSPGWTWHLRCGRHHKMRLCPHCLRIMHEELVALS